MTATLSVEWTGDKDEDDGFIPEFSFTATETDLRCVTLDLFFTVLNEHSVGGSIGLLAEILSAMAASGDWTPDEAKALLSAACDYTNKCGVK